MEHSVCCYQDASSGTLFWVLFLDEPEDFRLFHALHQIYAMKQIVITINENVIKNRQEVCRLRHETDQIEITVTQISFDSADFF